MGGWTNAFDSLRYLASFATGSPGGRGSNYCSVVLF